MVASSAGCSVGKWVSVLMIIACASLLSAKRWRKRPRTLGNEISKTVWAGVLFFVRTSPLPSGPESSIAEKAYWDLVPVLVTPS
jgi:hypothetical protein